MRVLCINLPKPNPAVKKPIIVIGSCYNVIYIATRRSGEFYELAEDVDMLYHSKCFAILSDIDETEIHKQLQTSHV